MSKRLVKAAVGAIDKACPRAMIYLSTEEREAAARAVLRILREAQRRQ